MFYFDLKSSNLSNWDRHVASSCADFKAPGNAVERLRKTLLSASLQIKLVITIKRMILFIYETWITFYEQSRSSLSFFFSTFKTERRINFVVVTSFLCSWSWSSYIQQQPIDSCWSSSQAIKITAKSCPCNQINCSAPSTDAKRR